MIARSLPAGLIMLSLSAGSALGFGTVDSKRLGQSREHEYITRTALQCTGSLAGNACFQPESLDNLAGKDGTMGAVGEPDVRFGIGTTSTQGSKTITPHYQSAAHCDNGDHPPALEECRTWMLQTAQAAARDAAMLITARTVDVSSTLGTCFFSGVAGRAKCTVLEDFGITLHAAQDFYAHTNWVDDAGSPFGLNNPPGLGHRGRADWLDLRHTSAPFPPGLISGCFEGEPEYFFCNGRIKHAYLNKDEGQIMPNIGGGRTLRGNVAQNFRHAVEAAVDDTRDKWLFLQERLYIAYGAESGALMACALTHDQPESCNPQVPELCAAAAPPEAPPPITPTANPHPAASFAGRRTPLQSLRANLIAAVAAHNSRCDRDIADGSADESACKSAKDMIEKAVFDYVAACRSYNADLVAALKVTE